MEKGKYRKLLAVVLSAALIFQAVPAFAAELPAPETEGVEVSIDPVEVPVLKDGEGTAKINDVVIYENGYAQSTVYINAELPDPDTEYHTVYFRITEGEYAGQDIFVQIPSYPNYLDEKPYNYFVYVPTYNKVTKGKVVIVKGNYGETVVAESEELTLNPKNLSDFKKFEVTFSNKGVTNAEWDYTLEDSSTEDSYDFCIYYRKKGSLGEWEEHGKLTNYQSKDYISNLEPGTEYEFYATARIFYYNPKNSHNDALPNGTLTYGSAESPKTFKTLPNTVFTAADFEDPNFYEWLLATYGGRDNDKSNLTMADMSDITSIDRSLIAKPEDFAPFTSIGGIENFTWLTSVELKYNDLATIPGGEWLDNLSSLDLTGNLLTEIPDLSQKKANQLRLERNCLTKEAVTDKLPKDMDEKELLAAQQNKDEKLEITSPDIFYPIGSSRPFFIYPNNNVLRLSLIHI